MSRSVVVALLFLTNLNYSIAEELAGHWEGSVAMRGVSWPVEMDFGNNGTEVTATLSIPSMGMIGNPIEITSSSTGGSGFSFPFGIGEFELNPDEGLILAHRKLKSGRRITLLLERIEKYELPYRSEEVSIPNGKTPLEGTMYFPNDAKQPTTGVVILHGSGPGGRNAWEYRSWADYYARLGIAALIYDKRSYDEVYPDLSVLADDAKTALTFFQNRSEIKEDAVGFAGGSQAAWLATSVASQSDGNVAFIIMSGWPAVTPGEQELQARESKLKTADLTPAEFDDAMAYLNLYFYVAHSGRLWEELLIAAKTASTTNWSKLVPIANEKTELSWWSRNHSFPTQQHLQKVKCPVLACYGGNDSVVPPARNADRLQEIITQSGNSDVTVCVFDDADHRIEMSMIIDAKQVRWPQLSADYLEKIESWLRTRHFSRE